MAATPCSVGSRRWPPRAPTPHPRRPLSSSQTLAPPYKYRFLASSPKIRRRPWGFLPVHRKERGGEGEKEKLEERRIGSRMGKPEAIAPLDHQVAVRPSGEAA
jgi:hypothetical protein